MGDDVQNQYLPPDSHAARTHGPQQLVFRERRMADGIAIPMGVLSAGVPRRQCSTRTEEASQVTGSASSNENNRKFELYWAIPGIAAVMLQMNPRLSPDDLCILPQHSDATFIVVDETLASRRTKRWRYNRADQGLDVLMTERSRRSRPRCSRCTTYGTFSPRPTRHLTGRRSTRRYGLRRTF